MPSTFASAAAGNATDSNNRRASGRADSASFAEWSRRPNGATQTFRRPSVVTNTPTHTNTNSRDVSNHITSPSTSSGAYIPPHISASRNAAATGSDLRYSREHLLELFRNQAGPEESHDDLLDLFVGDWDRFAKRDDLNDIAIGPEVCLEHSGHVEPLGLVDMSHEEHELFSTSVNSPLKAPNQGGPREGQRDISGARKMSLSQAHGGTGLTSPIATRPFGRRRDTNESFPFPKDAVSSPSATKFGREDPLSGPPHPLVRRKTDLKDQNFEDEVKEGVQEEGDGNSGSFGLSRRMSGPLSAGIGGAPPSPWSSGGNFGAFGASNNQSSAASKRPGGLNRSESRFKNLMSRESTDNTGELGVERVRVGLETLSENERRDSVPPMNEDEPPQDANAHTFRTKQSPFDQNRQKSAGPNQSHFASDSRGGEGSAFDSRGALHPTQRQTDNTSSPTFTNPYQSPERNMPGLNDYDADDLDAGNFHLPGLGNDSGPLGIPSGPSARVGSGFDSQPFERSQPFPPGPQRGLSGLGGLGTLPSFSNVGQWPTSLGSGTPSRERGFQGPGDLSSMNDDLQNPPFPGLGNLTSYGTDQTPNDSMRGFGGGRLGSLFPSGMQDQMRASESMAPRERPTESYDPFSPRAGGQSNLSMSGLSRDIGGPFGTGSGRFNDPMSREDKFQESGADIQAPLHQRYSPGALNQQPPPQSGQLQQQAGSEQEQPHGQPPAAQQKTMVMPDRIRWIYRDPQGNTQGPWSGLEMHDWYRAGFFSPELLVKKVEDPDYEPLAQLIRRIGNSREPFLVPQIGIPGPPSTSGSWPAQPTATITAPPPTNNNPPSSAAQPPFASSFPSFGTTLTAEQQNALERRKQEEQYLMARQKEHLAQQQVLAKQRQMQNPHTVGGPSSSQQQLHHHSSAHSLQSQPSYGSIGGPGYQGMQLPPGYRQASGAFESGLRGDPSAGTIGSGLEKADASLLIDPLSLSPAAVEELQQLAHRTGMTEQELLQDERVAQVLIAKERLALEQAERDALDQEQLDMHAGGHRLQEFQDLQQESEHEFERQDRETSADVEGDVEESEAIPKPSRTPEHKLTLTEQVQKAASAKQSPAASAVQSPWASKVDKPIAESHPSSETSSPLPAPAARRSGRQSVADALAAESSQPASPAVETPSTSLAPWARDSTETTAKQPSLREIQEAEAQRAAKHEEQQSALRRAALEREIANQQHQVAPAPGLPSSSTWASGEPVTSPSAGAPSAWAKANSKVVATPGGTKKTLQQIQKEEEALAKKQKAAVLAASANHANAASPSNNAAQAISAGKRYADLASRAAAPPGSVNNAWTTVGAGGKPKTPAAAPAPATLQRTNTGTAIPSATTATSVKRPAGVVRTNSSAVSTAQDEFKKWAVGELRPDLNKGMNPEDFVNSLCQFPLDKDLITESVHAASSTMDSRHFAEEFVRRRTLADKGKPQPPTVMPTSNQPTSDNKSGGGWSEVARKGPAPTAATPKEDSAFKIVAAKKKGGKK